MMSESFDELGDDIDIMLNDLKEGEVSERMFILGIQEAVEELLQHKL
jgi:hypothetical protein